MHGIQHPPLQVSLGSEYGRTRMAILTTLIMVKIAISIWNIVNYPVYQQYDNSMHLARIATCGIYTTERYYNQPLYYALSCPFVLAAVLSEVDIGSDLIAPLRAGETVGQVVSEIQEGLDGNAVVGKLAIPFLQVSNVLMLLFVYCIWSFVLFPRMLPIPEQAFAASILLLALPGFQKLTAMTHPDILLVAIVTFVFWRWMEMKRTLETLADGLLWFGVLTGLVALTRPFALVPVACFAVIGPLKLLLIPSAGGFRGRLKRYAVPIAVFATIVFTISASWWGYRAAVTESAFSFQESESAYLELYRQRSSQYQLSHYVKFYTSFHVVPLMIEPNRKFSDEWSEDWKNNLNDSFFTLLFSDFWGDHWLYFSGKKSTENKTPYKRALFVWAFFLIPFFVFSYIDGLWRTIHGLRSDINWDSWLITMGMTILGAALFVVWQATSGFEPGKNSSVKFIYIAYMMPFFIAIMGRSMLLRLVPSKVLLSVLGILWILALPIGIYWD